MYYVYYVSSRVTEMLFRSAEQPCNKRELTSQTMSAAQSQTGQACIKAVTLVSSWYEL